jgi:hypothetical protein
MDLFVLGTMGAKKVHHTPSGDREYPWSKGPVQVESFKTPETLYEYLLGNVCHICLVGHLSGNETIHRLIMLSSQS